MGVDHEVPRASFAEGGGGEPAVIKRAGLSRVCARSASIIDAATIGAPHKWVTPSCSKASQIASCRTARKQICVEAVAVAPHVIVQPLQWNIGSVHKYFDAPSRR